MSYILKHIGRNIRKRKQQKARMKRFEALRIIEDAQRAWDEKMRLRMKRHTANVLAIR